MFCTLAAPSQTFRVGHCDVARICCEEGQSWKLGHGALTADFRAGCSSCSITNSFVTNAVLIESELLTSAPADLTDYTILGQLAVGLIPK